MPAVTVSSWIESRGGCALLGVFRWTNRVVAYAFLLVTDRYPPFQLSP
jgi:hypothetical protein